MTEENSKNFNLKAIVTELKESPLFNLSLGSKELFHSNFLYWIGNIDDYKDEFGNIFKDYLKNKLVETKLKNIEREENHIDLTLYYRGEQKILIENKVKSMAYKYQLEDYSNKYPGHSYILLSLSKPSFDIPDNWHFVDYSFLKKKLENLVNTIKNEYHKKITEDYIRLIDNLVKIDELTNVVEDDKFNFHSKDSDENYKD